MKHVSNFKKDLEWGKTGERVVADIQEGDSTEVKSERDLWITSGNHFVEVKSRGKPSGIMKTEANFWTVNFYKGDDFIFNITVRTQMLKDMIERNNFRSVPGGDNNTSWGLLVPIKKLIDYNSYIDEVENEDS